MTPRTTSVAISRSSIAVCTKCCGKSTRRWWWPQSLPIYREASNYPHLLPQGIVGNPDRLSAQELHDRAWGLVEPHFRQARQGTLDLYRQVAGTGRATADVQALVPAAYRGELEALFLAQGKHLWGSLDPGAGTVSVHETQAVGDEDLLNLAAVHTLRHGHTVYAVGPEEMPAGDILAGIYHLPLPKHGKRP